MTFLILFVLAALIIYLCVPELQQIAPGREYKSGTRSCFWRWTKVDSDYIVRLHVVKTAWFAVCLHWIKKPDAEPWLHDHPVSFLALILRGGYAERRWSAKRGEYIKINSWFNFVRASKDDRHRIILCRANTLTLCFMGPKTREWGFHIPAEGWVGWKDYYARLKAGENMRREDACKAMSDALSPTLDEMTRRVSLVGFTLVEEEGRSIDLGEPDFEAEEITTPRALPDQGEQRDCFKAEDGAWYWRDLYDVNHGPFHNHIEASAHRRRHYNVDFLVSREDFYRNVKL